MNDTISENHANEQYFFDAETIERCLAFVSPFESVCFLCAPKLASEFIKRGRDATVLDIDERFAHLPGFVKWDLNHPSPLPQTFDLIFCDPPFFNVSLNQIRRGLRLLSYFDPSRRILVSYLVRRRPSFMRTFARENMRSMGIILSYESVEDTERNKVELFANFDPIVQPC